jgi:hypothetical protein
MRPNMADARRKADVREALAYTGFTLVLLGLLVVMLWLSAIAPLKHVGIYLAATGVVGATCAFRARSDWKRSRMTARQRQRLEDKEVATHQAKAKADTGGSWARRIQDDA